jgi:hypothetical protein
MQHPKRFAGAIALGFVLAFVASCNRSETPTAAPTAPAAVESPAPFSVQGVSLGNAIGADKRVATPTNSFAKTDTIYASVATDGAAPSVTLAARWTFEGGQLVSESSQAIAPSGPTATEFHIAKPDGWPAGTYTVEISADGVVVASQQFSVAP